MAAIYDKVYDKAEYRYSDTKNRQKHPILKASAYIGFAQAVPLLFNQENYKKLVQITDGFTLVRANFFGVYHN